MGRENVMLFNSLFDCAAERKAVRKTLLVASGAALAVAAMQAPALAQTAPEDDQAITVTASRINRAGYEAPTPTTIVGVEAIQQQAPLNIVDVVNNLPSMTAAVANGNSISIGANRPNFRGLGPVRTLVLVDGNRMSYTDPRGGVDLNVIPTSLIKGIEVVSGGASADWGSDAVAGIINFHIDNTFEGLKGSVQCGQSKYGDNKQCGGGIGLGRAFLDDKLHVVAAFDFQSSEGVPDPVKREWNKTNYARIINPNYTATNGEFQNLTSDNACYYGATSAGIITTGPLKGTTFNAQGDPVPFTYGPISGGLNTLFMHGGTCEQAYSMRVGGIVPSLDRLNGYAKATYEITDGLRVYAEALRAETKGTLTATPNYNISDITVRLDNAYLPAQVRAAMVQNNITTFTFGRYEPEFAAGGQFGMTTMVAENTVDRYITGVEGDLPWANWTWDAHYQYSRAVYHSQALGSRNNVLWALSLDSVLHPTTGLPICRSTLTNPTNGCVPADIFGPGSISKQVVQYAGGTAEGYGYYTSRIAAANVQGELPFQLPAGVVSVAAGVETRNDHLRVTVDRASELLQWRYQGLQRLVGSNTVTEGYAEAVVPIFKDAPLFDNLELNVAGRITDYSNSGKVETWKLGFNYAPFDADVLRFRGTLSVDIRAPTLDELFATSINQGSGLSDPYCGGCFRAVPTYIGGNANLNPEEARTKVIGVVFRPPFLEGFTTSIDYYDIKIAGGITTLGSTAIANNCFAGLTDYCSALTRELHRPYHVGAYDPIQRSRP